MTTDQLLILDSVQCAEDLVWRKESYDAGHPDCRCSGCSQQIRAPEYFREEPGYSIGACKAVDDHFPVRLYNKDNNTEAVLHVECFMWLNERGTLNFTADGKIKPPNS